jgi:hypothetical protein
LAVVRHSYATAGRNARIDWKALSKRIGHSDVAFTMKQYVQTDLEADRQVANTLAELIIGGSLASIEIADETGGKSEGAAREMPVHKSVHKLHARGPLPVRERASTLVAGEGFEPSTSGL